MSSNRTKINTITVRINSKITIREATTLEATTIVTRGVADMMLALETDTERQNKE